MNSLFRIELLGCLALLSFLVGCTDSKDSPKQAETQIVGTQQPKDNAAEVLAKEAEGNTAIASPLPVEAPSKSLSAAVENEEKLPPPLWTEFNWDSLPVSNTHIGHFPFVTAPDNYGVLKKGRTAFSDDDVTVKSDFDQLIMFDGESFVRAEGKKAELHFAMLDKTSKWNQYKFDRSVADYLQGLGASLIFEGKIPNVLLKQLNEVDKMTVHQYIQGDPWNNAPVRHYVLNHQRGRVVFQVYSNTATGEIGVVELEGFKQTIKAPTAEEIKQAIDLEGKAILNILFDVDKATLKPEGQLVVDQIQLLLEQNPDIKLSIEGHTDNTGSDERNHELSQDRANVVMYSLAAKGIKIDRLKAKGFGASRSLVANDSEENKAKNRRVELIKF